MCQQLLQSGVNGVNIRRRIEPQRNATLVGDDNYSHSCAIETADRLGRARQQMKVGLGSDKSAFRHFFVQNPVAVEEDGSQVAQDGADNGVFHPVMMATVFYALVWQRLNLTSERNGAMPNSPDAAEIFGKAIAEHLEVVRQLEDQQLVLEAIARAMMATLRAGGKILWCGNGGSAADSQHLAAELVGRFRCERRSLASIALTTDSSILTAVANDYGYEAVFSRQIEGLGNIGDLLVGISTSGNSHNVIAALEAARSQGLVTVGFTGEGGGKIAQRVDHLLAIASRDTARIQEAHILAGHMVCDWIEIEFLRTEAAIQARAAQPEAAR